MPSPSPFAAYGVNIAELPAPAPKLGSGIAQLDQFLAGGLPFGAVTECGVPSGRGGRMVMTRFFARASQGYGLERSSLALWVRPANSPLLVYPPAWRAQGVDLRRVRFAHCAQPVAELKPLLMDPLFKLIVIDSPAALMPDELAYLARQARTNGQLILILRNYLLSSERGNVWSKLRLNCWLESSGGVSRFQMQVVRGFAFRQLAFTLARPQDGH